MLGAIVTTGFLGGAICAHFRIGEIGPPQQIVRLLIGMVAWLELYLRISALRALPLGRGRTRASPPAAAGGSARPDTVANHGLTTPLVEMLSF